MGRQDNPRPDGMVGVLQVRTARLMLFVIAVFALAPLAMGAGQTSVTGTWSGTLVFKGAEAGEEPLRAILRHDGTTLTGTAGPDADQQYRITKGKVVTTGGATALTFDLIINGVLTSFDLKLVDGTLKGEATSEGEDGHKHAAIVVLKKG